MDTRKYQECENHNVISPIFSSPSLLFFEIWVLLELMSKVRSDEISEEYFKPLLRLYFLLGSCINILEGSLRLSRVV